MRYKVIKKPKNTHLEKLLILKKLDDNKNICQGSFIGDREVYSWVDCANQSIHVKFNNSDGEVMIFTPQQFRLLESYVPVQLQEILTFAKTVDANLQEVMCDGLGIIGFVNTYKHDGVKLIFNDFSVYGLTQDTQFHEQLKLAIKEAVLYKLFKKRLTHFFAEKHNEILIHTEKEANFNTYKIQPVDDDHEGRDW